MPFWEVTLKDPLYKNRKLCSGEVEADTEYGAKRAYFDSLYKKIPTLSQTPFSAVLPFLTTRKQETSKPRTSEFPPENFFSEIRAKHKETSIEEELENSYYLPRIVRFVIEESLETGRIPKECPICGNPKEKLITHHWNPNGTNTQKEKEIAASLTNGYYRRMCDSCNSSLGLIFKSNYPPPWKTQYEKLLEYFKQYPETYQNVKEEGWWSLLSEEEWNRIKYIWNTTPRKILKGYLDRPTKRKNSI